jgi:hypothetical protein
LGHFLRLFFADSHAGAFSRSCACSPFPACAPAGRTALLAFRPVGVPTVRRRTADSRTACHLPVEAVSALLGAGRLFVLLLPGGLPLLFLCALGLLALLPFRLPLLSIG